ncbi:MAG: LLM class flavin-dependent oxidoreductase [Thermomicrobiales bacterium]
MTHPRELSIAFQTDKQPDIYSDLAREVERYGFDALSMYSDLTYQPPIVPLTLAALATSTIRLGPASLNPFTLHPVEIAGQIATLDMVSKGRAYLGISRGAWLDAIDIEQERAIDRVVDTFGTVRHLLSRSGYEFRGKTFKMRPDVRLRYEPQRPDVPMMVGSWGPRLIKAASSLVDEIKLGGSANPDVVPVVREWIGSSADAADPAIVLGAVTIVDEDGDEARAAVKREMALYLPVVAPLDPTVAVDPALLENIERLVREAASTMPAVRFRIAWSEVCVCRHARRRHRAVRGGLRSRRGTDRVRDSARSFNGIRDQASGGRCPAVTG